MYIRTYIMNKYIFELVILLIFALVLFYRNNQLIYFLNSNLGRFLFIIVVIILATRHLLLGIAILILFFIFREKYYVEGLDNYQEDDSTKTPGTPLLVNVDEVPLNGSITIKNVQTTQTSETLTKTTSENLNLDSQSDMQNNMWRKQNCSSNNLPMLNNKIIAQNDLTKVFDGFSFSDKPCNPCNLDCKFKLTSSNDSTLTSDSMRPISANTIPVSTSRFGNANDSINFSNLQGYNAGSGYYAPSQPQPLDNQPSNLVNKSSPNANKLSPASAPPASSIASMPK